MRKEPTPTRHSLPLRGGDFATLAEALDYAAKGETGCNFYTSRGQLGAVLPYSELRDRARSLARRLNSLGLERGSRVALVAETDPDFLRFFFACQYAGLVPVPLPVAIQLGSHSAYVEQLRSLLISCQASVAMALDGFAPFLAEAAEGLGLRLLGDPDVFDALPEHISELKPLMPDELAYIQYTSGSTRFPRGVMIKQRAVMHNLGGILKYGLQIRRGDRCFSWLPYYHDMGLVGFVLGPVASQLSVDYLRTRDFAMRPRQWLALMSQTRATISFSPSFGYELCVRRLREEDRDKFDLSAWRIAGAGAEKIRPEPLEQFSELLADSGFSDKAFLACYGMAECSLGISFAPLHQGLDVDLIDGERLAEDHVAIPINAGRKPRTASPTSWATSFVNCGMPLPDFEIEIRDDQDQTLLDRECGTIYVRSPSVMTGYFGDPEHTREVLSEDGWLNTGDIGYRLGDSVVITGRKKDLIIINGRNLWPQDLEYIAEQQPELRSGDASAFSLPGTDDQEVAVMVVQCREVDPDKRRKLVERLQRAIYQEMGIECYIELVAPRTLPRTSSGKLSRSRTRQDFLTRNHWNPAAHSSTVAAEQLAQDARAV
jgi:fatty-acyl-CoA synthase